MINFVVIIFGFTLLLILALIIAITIHLRTDVPMNIGIPLMKDSRRGPFWIGGCAGTRWGCCDDGVTSRLDQNGSNCPAMVTTSCSGTRFGCCADGITAKAEPTGSNCMADLGCGATEFGCCNDGVTAKTNKEGMNCPK